MLHSKALRATTLLVISLPLFAQKPFDLLLKNGHVVDAKNNLDAVRDVAIKDHRIAAVAANIAADQAGKVIDVKGLYVTPGWLTSTSMPAPARESAVPMRAISASTPTVTRCAAASPPWPTPGVAAGAVFPISKTASSIAPPHGFSRS